MEKQIEHCVEQLERFSKMFRDNNTDSYWERIVQFGYNLGRLVVLLAKYRLVYALNPLLSKYSITMAKGVINMGIYDKKYLEINCIDFGFAIGFIQEALDQNYQDWWKPISEHCSKEKWPIVEKLTRERLELQKIEDSVHYYLPVFCREKKLVWSNIYDSIVSANDRLTKHF
jgi:hypothetical protein